MIKEIKMNALYCDRCGKQYVNGDGFCAFTDEDSLVFDATENGWMELGDSQYCPDCIEYDEEADVYTPKTN